MISSAMCLWHKWKKRSHR